MNNRHGVTYFAMTLAAAFLMYGCGKGSIGGPTPAPTTLSGVVFEVTESGQVTVAGALVRTTNGRGSTYTDRNGRFDLPATDPMLLEIIKWQFEPAHQSISINGNTVADFQIVRKPLRTVSGFVTEDTETGRLPIEGAAVDIVQCGPDERGTYSGVFGTTDADGFYSLANLCDGQTMVSAYKKGYEFAPAADPCISDGYECRTLTIDGDTRFDIHLIKLN